MFLTSESHMSKHIWCSNYGLFFFFFNCYKIENFFFLLIIKLKKKKKDQTFRKTLSFILKIRNPNIKILGKISKKSTTYSTIFFFYQSIKFLYAQFSFYTHRHVKINQIWMTHKISILKFPKKSTKQDQHSS